MTPGIYTIPASEYHADPCESPSLSNSIAQILLSKSAAHAWQAHPRLNPHYRPDNDPKFDIGTAAHALLLEGSAAKIVVVEADDWRTKAAKEMRDHANANGMTAILAKHNVALNQMVEAAKRFVASSEIAGIFERGKPEQTAIWKEPSGIWCRSRMDWLTDDYSIILDYKTTEDASPEVFSRQLVRMGYHIQDAFYTRGIAVLADKRPEFIFLVQETSPPFACSLAGCSALLGEIARVQAALAIALWKASIESNNWPSYEGRIAWADAPAWLISQQGGE
jgi:hypothetical protein